MADAVHLSPSAYEDAFINTTNPKQTHALLQGRLSAAAKLNDQLADMYKERAQIEASYVSALQKLQSKRGGGGGVARDTLGAFSSVWEAIWGEVQEAVQVHSSLERKMKDEVETPLRSMAVKGDWGKQGAYDGNIERTIKHLDSCQTRLAKAQKKASSSSKDKVIAEVNAASEELNDAQQGWLIESPQVFGLYQAIDTNRLTALKEIFTKWETTRSDIARGEMEASERIMMMVLGWDTLEDLQDFLVKKGSAGGVGASERTPGSRMVSGASNVSRNTTASVVRRPSVSATPPRPRASQNNSSNDFSPAPAQGTPSGGTSNGLSSLNPLKSVFGRNRARASSNASSNRSGNGPRPGPGHTDSFTSSGGGGAGFDMLGDDDDEPTTRRDVASREGTEVLTPVRESNGQSSNQPAVDAEGYSVPPPDHDKKPWETTDLMDDDTDMHTTPLGEPGVGQSSLKMAIAPEPIHESEEEQRLALEKMKSTLAAPGAGPQRRGTVARGRRDVRNTMMINDIPDDQPLGLFVGGRSGGSLSASRGTSRAGSMQQVDSPTAITPTSGLPPLPLIPATNRASSMLSSISSHQRTVGNASAGGASVTGSQQGFRSSITETCNVVSRAGTIVRAMVTGQVEATFRDVGQAELARNGKTIKLRIERFEQLEKVAPNPQFVKALADGQPGEYAVDAEALAGAAAANPDRPVVLFKYQLHIQEGKADRLVPLTVTPQWKCDPTDTKLLIAYGASAESHILAGAGAERSPFDEPSSAAQIDEISFTVPISSANVSNPQSKPFPGEYDPVAKRIVYRAEPLTAETPIGKVAARLAVDEPTVPQPIAVRWIVRGVLCSNLDLSVLPSSAEDGQEGAFDEFGAEVAAGGGAWRLEGVARNCQSGKFLVD